MKTKETWIDETLNSLDGIRQAAADPDLLRKVEAKLLHQEKTTSLIRQRYYWAVAAGIAVLVALNILGVLLYHQGQNLSEAVPAALANDYLSYLGPIKL
jgi:hypothetical protein